MCSPAFMKYVYGVNIWHTIYGYFIHINKTKSTENPFKRYFLTRPSPDFLLCHKMCCWTKAGFDPHSSRSDKVVSSVALFTDFIGDPCFFSLWFNCAECL